jgi:hypothetical protein
MILFRYLQAGSRKVLRSLTYALLHARAAVDRFVYS